MPCWKDVVFGFRTLSSKEIKKIRSDHGQTYLSGIHFITFCCEPTKLLPYLMKRYFAAGGRFEQRKVLSFDNGFDNADLIINCAGLGSKEILDDNEMHAVRGQVTRVKAPWINEVVLQMKGDANYVIPNTDCVILGGTHQVDDFNLNVSLSDSAFISNGCKKIFPSLKNAETINEMVGLRPGRDIVRLEVELRDRKPTVIHNYGHGKKKFFLLQFCFKQILSNLLRWIWSDIILGLL